MAGEFRPGDVVVHPRRLEWGDGVVDQATNIDHEGRNAQRLVIRFAHRERVTLNTAVAPLMSKDLYSAMRNDHPSRGTSRTTQGSGGATSNSNGGWLSTLEQAPSEHELWRLPELMSDPFLSLGRRLEATLDSYRFSTEPRSLTAWAVAQTGLHDPLTKYTRQELESAFPRFARDRNVHLQDLVRLIKRKGEGKILEKALSDTRNNAAKDALRRAMKS